MTTTGQPLIWLIAAVLLLCVLVYAAIKISHFLIKMALYAFGLALAAGLVWWFFLRR